MNDSTEAKLERLRLAFGRLRSEADAHGRSREAAPWAELAAALEDHQAVAPKAGPEFYATNDAEPWSAKPQPSALEGGDSCGCCILHHFVIQPQPGVFEGEVEEKRGSATWVFLPSSFAGKHVRVEVVE